MQCIHAQTDVCAHDFRLHIERFYVTYFSGCVFHQSPYWGDKLSLKIKQDFVTKERFLNNTVC